MLNGYITIDELMIITGFDKKLIEQLMQLGMPTHTFNQYISKKYKGTILLNIKEVEKWLQLALY